MFIYYKIINGNTRLSITTLINILKRLMPAQLDPLPACACTHRTLDSLPMKLLPSFFKTQNWMTLCVCIRM